MEFSGFDKGTRFTPVPNPLFGPLLEQIEDLAELKVTLRGLWLLHRKRGQLQAASLSEFLQDSALLRGLKNQGPDPRDAIRRGLQLTVARGTFLLHRPPEEGDLGQLYLLNSQAGRAALVGLRRGVEPASGYGAPELDGPSGLPQGPMPSIFSLYENNVGTLSPLLSDQLKEAEDLYPWPWIEQSFQIAVAENKRSWRYIAGILRRWAAEGKDDGEPGRHPEKDNRQKYLEDYERRWSRTQR